MIKIFYFLSLVFTICHAYSQNANSGLPEKFKEVAIQAFQKVSPTTKQWFIDAAKQHPAGPFDTSWAKKKLRGKFSVNDLTGTAELFMVMIEYQRMMNKEAREDRKMANQDRQVELVSKENKLKSDNAKIDQMKQEAQQKADNQMSSANTDLWIGIISGVLSTGGNPANNQNKPVKINSLILQVNDSSTLKVKNSNAAQKEAAKLQNQAEKDDEAAKAAKEDHEKDEKDAVKKLLEQLATMQKNIKM